MGSPIKRGVSEFCKRCKYCAANCPSNAIPSHNLQKIESENFDFTINGDSCMKYFSKHNACGKCVFHCVLTKSTQEETKKRLEIIYNWYKKWIVTGDIHQLISFSSTN